MSDYYLFNLNNSVPDVTIGDLSILDHIEQSQRVVSCVLRSKVLNSDIPHLLVMGLSNLKTICFDDKHKVYWRYLRSATWSGKALLSVLLWDSNVCKPFKMLRHSLLTSKSFVYNPPNFTDAPPEHPPGLSGPGDVLEGDILPKVEMVGVMREPAAL